MTEKRFKETVSTGIVTDTITGKEYRCEMRIDEDLLKLMNDLNDENEQLKQYINHIHALYEENERLHNEVFRLKTELAYDRTVNDGKDWFKAEDEHLKWKSDEND